MPLFEVVILESPTEAGLKNGEMERLVYGPELVVAKTPESATWAVIMGAKDRIKADPNRSQVLVRPFV
jgi:hypothetical protein